MSYSEEELQRVMDSHGVNRDRAYTILAIEKGDSNGDVITDEDDLEDGLETT